MIHENRQWALVIVQYVLLLRSSVYVILAVHLRGIFEKKGTRYRRERTNETNSPETPSVAVAVAPWQTLNDRKR